MFDNKSLPTWSLIVLLILFTSFAVWGISSVPFHPDESTHLFMSSDFETLLRNPFSLVWTPEKMGDLRLHYREIDAPLTRYILGIGRSITGLSALASDWDWSKSWEENRHLGALPDAQLLYIGRLAMVLLLPISLFLIYLIGKKVADPICGLFAVILLGTNALILLHDRRAMAEAALTLGILFALWCFMEGERSPWLVGIGMALAFNAKQSTLSLLPIGLLSVCWSTSSAPRRLRRITWASMQFFGSFVLITFALNPFMWRYPVQALMASWNERQDLLERQLSDTLKLTPEKALLSPGKRAAVAIYNIYVVPPSFAELINYQEQTQTSEKYYLTILGHNLMRNLAGGSALLTLTVFGLILSITQSHRLPPEKRRSHYLLLLATLAQSISLILFVPLPSQRYTIPMVPIFCIWAAYGVSWIFKACYGIILRAKRTSA